MGSSIVTIATLFALYGAVSATYYVAPTVAPTYPAEPENLCWTETKKCRWEAKHSGYKCKDYYGEKYARCHPVMKYAKKCDKATTVPAKVPKKPEEYTLWVQANTTMVTYDSNYGPHVPGYPAKGASDYYYTRTMPTSPKGVTKKPLPPPTHEPEYVAHAPVKPAYTSGTDMSVGSSDSYVTY